MKKRQSGVLMHISSLPGAYGIGSFGKSAYDFVDFLVRTKQRYWQILPLGTTSYGDSPYQSFSAFAGNTHFIDLDILVEQGLLQASDLEGVDFGYAADGISLTTQVSPRALGKTRDEQVDNLVTILDGYFENGGQHVNLNVMDLNDVYEKIMSGEDVIVRISGYCVNTKYLTPEQKTELTQRVFHEVLSMDDALN
mgnify:CR=1 FL=1